MRAGASFLLDYFVVCESFLKVTRHNIFMDRGTGGWISYSALPSDVRLPPPSTIPKSVFQ